MAKAKTKIHSENHLELSQRLFQLLALNLRIALQENGVTDMAVQSKIIETALFDLAVHFDQEEITDKKIGGEWIPTLCFRNAARSEEEELAELIVPNGMDELHAGVVFDALDSVTERQFPDIDWNFMDGVNDPKERLAIFFPAKKKSASKSTEKKNTKKKKKK